MSYELIRFTGLGVRVPDLLHFKKKGTCCSVSKNLLYVILQGNKKTKNYDEKNYKLMTLMSYE